MMTKYDMERTKDNGCARSFSDSDFRRADHQPAGVWVDCRRLDAAAGGAGQGAGGQPPKPGADAGTPRAAQAKRDAGASGSGVSDEGRQKIQAVRCL